MPDLTNERVMNGSYMTKDLGFFDSSGRLYVLGRVDDLIIVQGRNVYAHQVEALVSTLEGIKPGRISGNKSTQPLHSIKLILVFLYT